MTGASTANADEPKVTVGIGPDPVESITTQLSVAGAGSSSDGIVELKVQSTGGEACAANPGADKGDFVGSESGNGTESLTRNWSFATAGTYLLCGWLSDGTKSGTPVVATASAVVTIRQPHISISVLAPASVRPAEIFQIATTAQSETTREVFQFILPRTGRGCPANAGAAASTAGEAQTYWPSLGSPWNVTGGPFTATVNEHFSGVGGYFVCAYAEYPSASSPPEATASATISVLAPPPPCVVPHFTSRSTVASIERRLLAAHCRVGAVRHVRSARYRRGRLISLSPRPGSRAASAAPVTIVVSAGRHRG